MSTSLTPAQQNALNQFNTYLQTRNANAQQNAPAQQSGVRSLIDLWGQTYKPEHYTEQTNPEGGVDKVVNEAGKKFEETRQNAKKQLENYGFELFAPEGSSSSDESGTYTTQPAKWLSPQEAANVTGTKVNNQLRNQAYIQSTENLASQLSPLANQLRQKLDAVNASGNLVVNQPARYYNEVANRLTQRTGITDLNDVGVRKLEGRWIELGGDPPEARFFRTGSNQGELYDEEIYNKKTGQVYEQGNFINLGTFGNKQDETSALLKIGPDGNIKLNAGYAYEQEAWKDVVGALAPLALTALPFTGAGQFISGITGSATNALTNLGLPSTIAKAGANSLVKGVLQGGISELTGNKFSTGFKSGAASGGIGSLVGDASKALGLDKILGSLSVPARSLATSALVAKAMNRPFDFGQAAQNAAINYGFNQAGQAAGFTPSQQKTLSNFLNFAAPMIAARRRP